MGEKVAPLSPAESASPKEEPGSPEGQPSRLGDGSTRTSEATLLAEDRLAHPKKRTLREHIAVTMEDPEDSKLAKGISVFMMFVILISTICFILESEVCDGMAESCQTPTTGFLPWDPWSYIFYYMEWISVLIFTADYCTRFACCGGPKEMWSFFWNIMNMIDLVAWLPFWLIGAASSPPFGLPERDASGVGGVGFVRAIRLVRVFRVFKAGKLRLGIKLFSGALVASIEPMSILCLVLTVTVIIFSSIIWLMEKPSSPLVSDHLCVTTGMCDTSDPRQGMQVVMPLHPATPSAPPLPFRAYAPPFWVPRVPYPLPPRRRHLPPLLGDAVACPPALSLSRRCAPSPCIPCTPPHPPMHAGALLRHDPELLLVDAHDDDDRRLRRLLPHHDPRKDLRRLRDDGRHLGPRAADHGASSSVASVASIARQTPRRDRSSSHPLLAHSSRASCRPLPYIALSSRPPALSPTRPAPSLAPPPLVAPRRTPRPLATPHVHNNNTRPLAGWCC